MKKKKIKPNFKRILLFIIILTCLIACGMYFILSNKISKITVAHNASGSSAKTPDYPIMKLDENPNYSGIRSNKSKWKKWIYHNFHNSW